MKYGMSGYFSDCLGLSRSVDRHVTHNGVRSQCHENLVVCHNDTSRLLNSELFYRNVYTCELKVLYKYEELAFSNC